MVGERIFHVNVVVRDLEKSLRFYVDILGMKLVEPIWEDSGPGQAGIGLGVEAYGIRPKRDIKIRFAFLRFGDDPDATMIDLLEFIRPRPIGGPYPTLHNVGIDRIALKVASVDQAYPELLTKGVKFITPPVTVAIREGLLERVRYCCFYDPDGTVLEIYSDERRRSRKSGVTRRAGKSPSSSRR